MIINYHLTNYLTKLNQVLTEKEKPKNKN